MNYKIKYKNKSYLVKAKDTQSALDGLSVVVPELSDERLSPMTYKKLKELGYSHETWKNLTQEKANKIVQQNELETEKKTSAESEPKPMDIKSHVGEIIKKFGTDKNTEINKITKNDDGSYNISIHLERDSYPYQEFDADIKNRANGIFKELKNSLKGKFNITEKNLFKGSYIHGVPNELSITITPDESDKPVSGGGNGNGKGPKDPDYPPDKISNNVQKPNSPRYNIKEIKNPKRFKKIFEQAKATVDAADKWRVDSSYTPEDYSNMNTYISDGGSTVAIHDGDIVSVCHNSKDIVRGKDLIALAKENGGVKLDAFKKLFGFYQKQGFTPISRTAFSDDYIPEGWDANRDEKEDIVFWRISREGDPEYESFEDFANKVPLSKDYETAQKERDLDLNERK